ncbi:hypothetical protein BKA63DRAFT_424948 [Paraphoma chrysanthemicola]|nr:hypothetical protein BKA63DRAFT_424948 [Paraphoma chrysanthemicola]
MSLILVAALLAASVSADVTTSIWLPGAANANQTFLGSVVGQNGDQTVLSLAFAQTPSTPDYFSSAPGLATVGGTTYVAYNVSGVDSASSDAATITIELQCRRPSGGASAVPTCTLSTVGAAGVISDLCDGLTTFSGESQFFINNYPLIITAGTEKLSATAAGTPRASSATATGAVAASGPSAGTASGASPVVSGASGSAQQATGAAPMKTMAPVLGLGAAAAAFFL